MIVRGEAWEAIFWAPSIVLPFSMYAVIRVAREGVRFSKWQCQIAAFAPPAGGTISLSSAGYPRRRLSPPVRVLYFGTANVFLILDGYRGIVPCAGRTFPSKLGDLLQVRRDHRL